MIYEVWTVFKTSLLCQWQTDPAKIQGHINKWTDCWGYRNDSEIQGVLGVNSTYPFVHLSPFTTAKANMTYFNSTRHHWPKVSVVHIFLILSSLLRFLGYLNSFAPVSRWNIMYLHSTTIIKNLWILISLAHFKDHILNE